MPLMEPVLCQPVQQGERRVVRERGLLHWPIHRADFVDVTSASVVVTAVGDVAAGIDRVDVNGEREIVRRRLQYPHQVLVNADVGGGGYSDLPRSAMNNTAYARKNSVA